MLRWTPGSKPLWVYLVTIASIGGGRNALSPSARQAAAADVDTIAESVGKRKRQSLSDTELIRGAWTVVSLNGDTKTAMQGLRFVFTKDRVTVFHKDGKTIEYPYRIDADKNPKTFDMYVRVFAVDVAVKGIYTLQDNTLRVCTTGTPGLPRPRRFPRDDGPRKTGPKVLVYKKVR